MMGFFRRLQQRYCKHDWTVTVCQEEQHRRKIFLCRKCGKMVEVD